MESQADKLLEVSKAIQEYIQEAHDRRDGFLYNQFTEIDNDLKHIVLRLHSQETALKHERDRKPTLKQG